MASSLMMSLEKFQVEYLCCKSMTKWKPCRLTLSFTEDRSRAKKDIFLMVTKIDSTLKLCAGESLKMRRIC